MLPHTSPLPSNQSIDKILWTSGRAAPAEGTRLKLSSGRTIPLSAAGAAGLPRKLRRQSGGGDMEGKGIVLPEMGCRTAAELPTQELPDYRRSGRG